MSTRHQRQELLSSLLDLLLARYTASPKEFRAYLPEVAQLLDQAYPQRRTAPSPFGLTERERSRRMASFTEGIGALTSGSLSKADAIRILEDYAVLLKDNSVAAEFDFDKRLHVFKSITGKAPGSFKSESTIPVSGSDQANAVTSVALVRGVRLHLTWDMKLVSINVSPQRYRERKKLMAFIGIGHDEESDVAERHDHYLGRMDPHGAA